MICPGQTAGASSSPNDTGEGPTWALRGAGPSEGGEGQPVRRSLLERRRALGLARLGLLWLGLVAAGCASSLAGPPPRGPFTWETRPDPSELRTLRERLGPWLSAESAACLATLVRGRLDLVHALLGGAEVPLDQRAALVAALPPREAEAWSAQPAPWREAEAILIRAAAALAGPGPSLQLAERSWPSASQAARAAYLQLGADWRDGSIPAAHVERALSLSRADWTTAQRLEEMRTLGGFSLPPGREYAWRVQLAQTALARGRSLVAIQHAAAARVLSSGGVGDPLRDRALLTRAYLSTRQIEAALNESEGALALARSPAQRAQTESLRGQALLLAGEAREAADAFALAQRAALEAHDEAGALRQVLNRSVARLKAGELGLAQEASAELRALASVPTGPEAEDLVARRAILASLAALLAGELDPNQAAARVEAALARARETGQVAVLESYSRLPERLRRGRP